jgi:fermentation-respiration switch protein FrsA (DUF1100 family)
MRHTTSVLACLFATAAAAQTTEVDLTIPSQGQSMAATLSLPEGDPAPVVLLFHGFTGSRDELPIPGTDEGVFSRTARLLAEAGYASLRIDFIGSGDSDGDYADTTFEGQIEDGVAAFEFLAADPRVQGDDIHIIGWSQGGLVAAGVAGKLNLMSAAIGSQNRPDAVALWAAVANPEETFGGLLGAEALTAGLATGDTPYTITLPWGADVSLKQPFFESVATFDPLEKIASYNLPLFVAQGTLDPTVLPANADAWIAAHDGPEELWTADMDHAFNVFTETATLDAMVAATVAFFDAHAD